MTGWPTLLEDSIRDFGQEQDILAIGHRIANVRMTDPWRAFLLSCTNNEGPLDVAWRLVVEECLRYLVNARSITGRGLTITDVATWVASLAQRHAFVGNSQQLYESLARDIIVVGLMASGEEVRCYVMRGGKLERTHAPAIVEEREAGVYQPTLEAMDYAFRNLDYERAYDQAFRAKDIMLKKQVESGNYDKASEQVRSLRRVLAMIRIAYQNMLDGLVGELSATEMHSELASLARDMEYISGNRDLDRIAEQLDNLSLSPADSRMSRGLISARKSLQNLMVEVDEARDDIHDMMSLRARAEAGLDERLSRGMTVRSQGRTVNLSSLLDAAACGRISLESLVDLLLVSASSPRAMGRIVSWGTLLFSASEREVGPRGGGVDLASLSDVVDEQKLRVERAKTSMGASLEVLLANPHAQEEGVKLSTLLESVSDEERYEWLDTGVFVAFVHSLHMGRADMRDGHSDAGWKELFGENLRDAELTLSCERGESTVVDAVSKDGTAVWELEFEGRRIELVK